MTGPLKLLIIRVSEGDPSAFRELFEQFSPKVHGFALKLTHSQSTAEEMVQEVFMRIWLNRNSLAQVDYFPAYIYAITRNLALNVLKHSAIEEKVKNSIAKDLREIHSDTEETIVYRDYNNILNRAIDGLPPQQKLVYSLCHGEGLKYEEVAQRLQISRLTVKTHMQQALRTIKLHFNGIVKVLMPLLLMIN